MCENDLIAARRIEEILAGAMRSRSLVMAHRLGIFEVLSERSLTIDELSDRLLLKNRLGVGKLLSTLESLGLLASVGESYALTDTARASLLKSSPGYFGDLVDFFAQQLEMKTASYVQDLLRLGSQPAPTVSDQQWSVYMAAMESMARMSADAIAQAIDFGNEATVLDLGGGPGLYAIAFCQRFPQLFATIYDLPAALQHAEAHVRAARLSERITCVAGSATDAHYGGPYDVIFVSHTIHLFDPAAVGRMFRACHASLKPGGRLVVRDVIMNDSKTTPSLGSLVALNMWLDGEAYSFGQIAELMREAGLADISERPIAGGQGPEVLGSLVIGRSV